MVEIDLVRYFKKSIKPNPRGENCNVKENSSRQLNNNVYFLPPTGENDSRKEVDQYMDFN